MSIATIASLLSVACCVGTAVFAMDIDQWRVREMHRQALQSRHRQMYGRGAGYVFPGRPERAPNHLDLGLPEDLLDSESSILLHLKDQDLFDKELSGKEELTKAALYRSPMGSVKSLKNFANGPTPSETDNFKSVEGDVKIVNNPSLLLSMMKKEHYSEDNPDLEYLEELFDDGGLELQEDMAKEPSKPKIEEILQKFYDHDSKDEATDYDDNEKSGFNFRNLEHLTEKLNLKIASEKPKEGSEVAKDEEGSMNIRYQKLLKTMEKYFTDHPESETTDKGDTQDVSKESQETTSQVNELMRKLENKDITVESFDNDGGVHFKLQKGSNPALL